MTEYIILFFISLFGFTKVRNSKFYVYFLLIIMFVLIACRGMSVGTDTYGYSQTFKHLTLNPNSWSYDVYFDPGFAVLCYFFKTFVSPNPLDCWGLMGVFYVLSFFYFARKYTRDVGLAVVLFVMYDSYFIGFNIIRQCFALSCVMCVFIFYDLRKLSVKDKIWSSMWLVLIGYLFHPTMLIFCFVPFMASGYFMKIVNKKILMAIVIGTFAVNISGLVVSYAISFLESTGIEGKLISYMSRVFSEESGYSVLKLLLVNGFMGFSIAASKNVKNVFLLTGVTGVVVLNLLDPVVIEMVRVYESLMVFGLIYFSQIITPGKCQTTSKTYYPVLISVMIVLCLNHIMKGYGEILPYVFR